MWWLTTYLGAIHKRRRQFEGGKRSKFIEIGQKTEMKKTANMGEVGVKKSDSGPTSFMDGP